MVGNRDNGLRDRDLPYGNGCLAGQLSADDTKEDDRSMHCFRLAAWVSTISSFFRMSAKCCAG